MNLADKHNAAAMREALKTVKRYLDGYTVNVLEMRRQVNAALKRESGNEVPDPDWAEICAKCRDGEVEPKDCEYYGEPCGCNSPIYGQHPKSAPTSKESLAVGNAAALSKCKEGCAT